MGRIAETLKEIEALAEQLTSPELKTAPGINSIEVKKRTLIILEQTRDGLARLRGWVAPPPEGFNLASALLAEMIVEHGTDVIALAVAVERAAGYSPAIPSVLAALRELERDGRAYPGALLPGSKLETSRLWFRASQGGENKS